MHMRRLAASALLAFLAMGASAHAADTVIATVDRPTALSAYGSGLLWSALDPATGSYRLMYTETGTPPTALPVPQRSVPFDADLGPGPRGRFLAVYSRCAQEPEYNPLDTGGNPPDYTTGRGCDLYQYDLTRKVEKKLRNASSPRASEVWPAVWKDRIAFARVYDDKRERTYVYERPRTTAAASRRMPAGTASTGRRRAYATALDLYGRRLALAWTYDSGTREGMGSQIRLDDTRTKAVTTVDDFRGGGLTTIERGSPGFEGGKLYYARLCRADPGGCPHRAGLVRDRYSTGELAIAPIGRYDLRQARGERGQGDSVTYVLRDSSGFRACYQPEPGIGLGAATCTIVATQPEYVSPR
jgi:hypothetical protein